MLKELSGVLAKIKSKGSFARNISITSSWNVVGILLQFILSPIVTRLYSPAEYGAFAIYNSIVLNISIIATLRYVDAIILAPNQRQQNNAILLSLVLAISISAISLVAVLAFNNALTEFVGHNTGWFYFIPLSVFLTGLIEILLFINVRKNKFFINGFAGFVLNLSSRGFAISYGTFFPPKANGLIGGDITGKILALMSLSFSLFTTKKMKEFYSSVDRKSMMAIAKIYRLFPIYSLPTNILSSIAGHIPIYLLQAEYTSTVVGAFALSSSLFDLINRLIPYSISSAFLLKAKEMKAESMVVLARGTYRLFIYLAAGAFIIFGSLALISTKIFPLFFGSNWQLAGSFASLLALSYGMSFISASFSEAFKVIEQQRSFLFTTVAMVILKISSIFVALQMQLDEKHTLLLFSLAGALGGFFQSLILFIKLKYKVTEVMLILIALFCLLLFFGYTTTF